MLIKFVRLRCLAGHFRIRIDRFGVARTFGFVLARIRRLHISFAAATVVVVQIDRRRFSLRFDDFRPPSAGSAGHSTWLRSVTSLTAHSLVTLFFEQVDHGQARAQILNWFPRIAFRSISTPAHSIEQLLLRTLQKKKKFKLNST